MGLPVSALTLRASPLTAAAFAPYGDVIEVDGRPSHLINSGTCRRFDDLAQIDVTERSGVPLLSVFEAEPRPLPLQIQSLERHPLSSQAFFPLEMRPFLIIVATDGPGSMARRLRAFRSSGRQGVNYRRNTWHHALIALHQVSRFLVVDRGGPGENCEEVALDEVVLVMLSDEQE